MLKHAILYSVITGSLVLGGCKSNSASKTAEEEVNRGRSIDTDAVAASEKATRSSTQASTNPETRPLGRLIDGALGAGGGYLVGIDLDKLSRGDATRNREMAVKASERAEQTPAKVDAVDGSRTADLNEDGFVTLDEVVAMRQANLSDDQMLDHLQATGLAFEMTDYQLTYLHDRGVSPKVTEHMQSLNQNEGIARTASDRVQDAQRDDHHEAISRTQDAPKLP